MKAELLLDTDQLKLQIAEEVIKALKPILFNTKQDDIIFDVKGLADYLKVSKAWIYERTHLKEIPHLKIDGQLRFNKRAIDKWLSSYKIPVLSTAKPI